MSERTAIAWTQSTWNPWHGCTKVSPGCAHCYMFRDKLRYGQNPELVQRSKTKFAEPLRWKEPRVIFTCSWSDWFHGAADAWRDDAWNVIRSTPQHTYQILTKRPERIEDNLPEDWGDGWSNVWLGVSVENQRHAYRVLLLLDVPAKLRFVSAEPLLGPLNLTQVYYPKDHTLGGCPYNALACFDGLNWVIAGGESGPEHRPCESHWLQDLRDQCAQARVPFFLKQLGGWPDARAHEKALLDGQTYTEMPQVTA